MEKVTLKLSGSISNIYNDEDSICRLKGMELSGTPEQIGLLYFRLIGLSDNLYIDVEKSVENLEVLRLCSDAIGNHD